MAEKPFQPGAGRAGTFDTPSNTAAEQPQPTLLEQMGGLGGLFSSTLPILVLIPVNNRWGLLPALAASLAVAAAIFVWRLVRKDNLQPAISGLMGVAIGAAFAYFTGDAKGYFLYGIWMSLLFAVVFIASSLVGWPAVGVIWKGLNGDGMVWRTVPKARRAYHVATLAWAVVFTARFVVQRGFYNADDATALAAAKILMGWPLTGIVMLVTVWAVRHASKALEDYGEHSPNTPATPPAAVPVGKQIPAGPSEDEDRSTPGGEQDKNS